MIFRGISVLETVFRRPTLDTLIQSAYLRSDKVQLSPAKDALEYRFKGRYRPPVALALPSIPPVLMPFIRTLLHRDPSRERNPPLAIAMYFTLSSFALDDGW